MRKIRRGIFETNSSSTHTMTILTQEEYDNLENMIFIEGEIHTLEEAIDYYNKESEYAWNDFEKVPEDISAKELLELAEENELYFKTWDEYCDDDYLEVNRREYTTKSGDTIHIICKHGYNG